MLKYCIIFWGDSFSPCLCDCAERWAKSFSSDQVILPLPSTQSPRWFCLALSFLPSVFYGPPRHTQLDSKPYTSRPGCCFHRRSRPSVCSHHCTPSSFAKSAGWPLLRLRVSCCTNCRRRHVLWLPRVCFLRHLFHKIEVEIEPGAARCLRLSILP